MKERVAAIQMASGPNIGANLIEAARLIAQAAADGARLVVLPENFACMPLQTHDLVKVCEPDGSGAMQDFLRESAVRHGLWIVGGTVPLHARQPDRIRAACLLIGPDGQVHARYDKIHLFDVHLVEGNEHYNESETIESGDQPVVADTPFGRLGLAICYDLRFPELFRSLIDKGAEVIALPAAFTAITGRAHWESLLRARAIENLAWIIAAAQGGYHVNGRETHGDSMIIDPWGQICDRLPRGSGVVAATIDSKRTASVRRTFPALLHRRL